MGGLQIASVCPRLQALDIRLSWTDLKGVGLKDARVDSMLRQQFASGLYRERFKQALRHVK